MTYKLRRAGASDMPAVYRMIAEGRESLAARGVDQWQTDAPGAREFARDCALSQLWVLTDESGAPCASAALCFGDDPSYRVITDGAWENPPPYAAIHRVAVAGRCRGRGVAGILFDRLCRIARDAGVPSVRVDTHENNRSMRRALEKSGFVYRGRVRTLQGRPRVAYEKSL